MRAFQEEAILLEVADLQEADRVVVFLTREHGKRRGAARGAKRKFSRYAGQLQPLAKVRIGWFEKEGRELVRISALELIRAPKRLGGDLEGILLGAYLGCSIIVDAVACPLRVGVGQQVRAEESRLDDRDLDPELPDFLDHGQ